MYRRFLRRPRRKIVRRRAYRGKRGSVSMKIKKYVKKELHRNVENKEYITYAANDSLSTSVSPSTPAGLGLIPALPIGAYSSYRVGNSIKIVKGVIQGFVNIKPYNVTTNPLSTPVIVKMWLVRDLRTSAQQAIGSVDFTTFFKASAAGYGFQGTMLDAVSIVNNEQFRLLGSKTIKIGAGYASATGAVGTGGYFDNSPMTKHFYFNWGKYCKKILKFNDAASNLAQNENIYLVINTFYADGSSSSMTPAEWHYTNYMKYEDA